MPVAGGEAGGLESPPEIFRLELNSATKGEFCFLQIQHAADVIYCWWFIGDLLSERHARERKPKAIVWKIFHQRYRKQILYFVKVNINGELETRTKGIVDKCSDLSDMYQEVPSLNTSTC